MVEKFRKIFGRKNRKLKIWNGEFVSGFGFIGLLAGILFLTFFIVTGQYHSGLTPLERSILLISSILNFLLGFSMIIIANNFSIIAKKFAKLEGQKDSTE